MTIVLALRDRRCDATCHNAIGGACVCICGGRYHGKGDSAPAMIVADYEGGRLAEAGIDPEAVPEAVQVGFSDMPTPIPAIHRKPREKAQKRPVEAAAQEGLL